MTNTITKNQKIKNLDNEVMTIKSITSDVYPTNKINGAYVHIKTQYSDTNQWMSISAIYNFMDN